MMKRFAIIRFSIITTLAVLVGAQSACLGENNGSSRNEVRVMSESASPDGKFVARYFVLSGGGAAGYVIDFVNIQPAGEAFNNNVNVVFQATGTRVLKLDWAEPRLKITYEKGGNILQPSPDQMKNMPIDFIQSPETRDRNANRNTQK
jgi:hypothetical protein